LRAWAFADLQTPVIAKRQVRGTVNAKTNEFMYLRVMSVSLLNAPLASGASCLVAIREAISVSSQMGECFRRSPIPAGPHTFFRIRGPQVSRPRFLGDRAHLDTAPHATTPTIASYMAADFFILAAVPEHFAIYSLKAALDDIRTAKRRGNSRLELLGVVLSCVNKRYRTAQLLAPRTSRKRLRRKVGGLSSLKFDTEISRDEAIPQCQQKGQSIFQMEPAHKVAEEYRQLAREVESRISEFRYDAGPTRIGRHRGRGGGE
jgi:hypothetical protein